jgi:hypothetical protein
MKLAPACILFTLIILNNFILTGCLDKTAQIRPTNWNCRQDEASALAHRVEKLEHEGKIDNASEFIDRCQQDKLGIFSDEYENLSFSSNYERAQEKLFTKWEKEDREEAGTY